MHNDSLSQQHLLLPASMLSVLALQRTEPRQKNIEVETKTIVVDLLPRYDYSHLVEHGGGFSFLLLCRDSEVRSAENEDDNKKQYEFSTHHLLLHRSIDQTQNFRKKSVR